MKFNWKISNLKLRIHYRGKKKKVELQAEHEAKQKSGESDVENIKDKNEAEKVARYYGAEELDEEDKLEKIKVEKLGVRLEKESKTIGSNSKGIKSALDKKADKLEAIGKLKKQKFEKISHEIINNENIKRKVPENQKQ